VKRLSSTGQDGGAYILLTVSIRYDGWEMFPKTELCEWLSKINSPDFSNNAYGNTPHTVLALICLSM
jgi:hypothetical protein